MRGLRAGLEPDRTLKSATPVPALRSHFHSQSFRPLRTLLRNALSGSGDNVAVVFILDRAEIGEVRLPKMALCRGLAL